MVLRDPFIYSERTAYRKSGRQKKDSFTMKTLRIWLAMLGLAASASSEAQLISLDWKSSGDELITSDRKSGLNWLDLTETFNQSLSEITPALAEGGRFEGFRIATKDEVWQLITNAGLPEPDFFPPVNPYSPSDDPLLVSRAESLTGLLGETVGRHWGPLLFGTRGYVWDDGQEALSGFWTQEHDFILYQTNVVIPGVPGSGVWLVSPIPEAGALSWISGILLIVAACGRRWHRSRLTSRSGQRAPQTTPAG